MARRKPKRRSDPFREPSRESKSVGSSGIPIARLLSAAVCALLVARPLFPSEGASYEGDGQMAVMLWLLVALGWALSLFGRGEAKIRFGWTDAAVVALVAAHTIAAVWGCTQAAPRPAVNMLWEWVAMGLGFLLVRQLLTESCQIRAVVAIMIGLAVITAGCGLYQYFVEMPATQAAYKADPEGMLQAAGLSIEADSAQRKLFEDRLESVEPMATFALANSLAGFLAPWLVVAVAIGVVLVRERSISWRTFAAVGWSAVIISICLMLTKSRSGVLAVLAGIMLSGLVGSYARRTVGLVGNGSRKPRSGERSYKLVCGGLIVLLLVAAVVGLTAVGGLDKEILSEASKSLGYRVQYWESTARMIAEYPLLGCGPGAFQQTYTQFKLPEASEEIADPHNFFLEIWATAGPAAALAMLAVLCTFAWTVWSKRASQTQADSTQPDQDPLGPRFLLSGGVVGLLLAFPLGLFSGVPPGWGVYVVGIPLGAITVGLLWPWVVDGRLPAGVLAAAAGALAVNLLFAGGIAYPGVAGTFWLLIALELNGKDQGAGATVSRGAAWLVMAPIVTLLVGCYVSSYKPVMTCSAALSEARISPDNALERLLAAAKSDPLASEPWRQAAGLSFEHWRHEFQSDPQDRARWADALEDFQSCQREILLREPRSAASWHDFGDRLIKVYELTYGVEFQEKAIDAYNKAVVFYPTNAVYRADLALALLEAGQRDQAEIHAREAWRLDDLTPHEDKKLPTDLREQLLRSSIGKD